MSVVLMYHALHAHGDRSGIAPEDRPYAVATEAFARQLDAVAERLARTRDGPPRTHGPAVALTFDDGHVSNVELALPMLAERGLTALFFVTTDFVGAREHFVDAVLLRELVAAGMSVGGHGRSHRFLDDLDAGAARDELAGARGALEAVLGAPVRSMSFPGGRHDARALRLAAHAGIDALFDSRCAVADPAALARALALAANAAVPADDAPGGPAGRVGHVGRVAAGDARTRGPAAPLPRVAIRSDTDMTTFARMIDPDPAWYSAARRGERLRHLARRVLGNRIYHGLYKSLRAG